ncbi:MAG: hypothetical protein K9M08_21425, partial [Pirellula sp.]|nr:hypothetical protein [Pirellula sp.]
DDWIRTMTRQRVSMRLMPVPGTLRHRPRSKVEYCTVDLRCDSTTEPEKFRLFSGFFSRTSDRRFREA